MWQIRRAQDSDRDPVLRLWDTVGLGRTTDDEWSAITTGDRNTVLVAEENGAIVGAGVATYDGWRAYIYHVAVAPDQRQRGIARALMAEAEQHLVRQGARRVYALVNEDNTAGLALCAGSGYEPEGDIAFVKELPIQVPA